MPHTLLPTFPHTLSLSLLLSSRQFPRMVVAAAAGIRGGSASDAAAAGA